MDFLRQTVRQLTRRPSQSLLSASLLGLGVGLAAAFYSVLDSALLSGLPYPEGDRMVAFSTRDAAGWPMPVEDHQAISESVRSFEWTESLRTFNTMVTRGTGTQGLIGGYVTADLFARLGVEPILGRVFDQADEDPSNPPVAVISRRLWHSSYGADPGVIGEQIVINREPTIVVGVMPAEFHFPLRHDVWGILRNEGRSWSESPVFGFAKLARGATLAQARQELRDTVGELDRSDPQTQARNHALDWFVSTNIGDRAKGALHAMVLAALGLLLLTCANLANLRLSETLRRQREFTTRQALGAGVGGLARMLLVENLMIGVVGMVLALGFAWLLIETLGKVLLAGSLARVYWVDAGLDLSVVRFAAAMGLLSTLLGAAVPIFAMATRSRSLVQGASPIRTSFWSRGLVSAQVALCFSLLVLAGLFAVRAHQLLDLELGFEPGNLSSLQLSTYQTGIEDAEERSGLLERVRTELLAQDSVASATFSSRPPWGYIPSHPVAAASEPDQESAPSARVLEVSRDFFETLGVDALSGRTLTESDLFQGSDVAVISLSLSHALYESSALEQSLVIGGQRRGEESRRVRIVGVVPDLGLDRADDESRNLLVYLPNGEHGYGACLLTRVRPGTGPVRQTAEEVLARVAPLIGTLDELSVEQALSDSTWVERRLGQIFSLFGVAALLLTAAGMYAVIAVMVRSRERELGIRSALGACPRDLTRLVLSESILQLTTGLALGLAALWALKRLVDSVLTDGLRFAPGVLIFSTLAVTLICLAASWRPTAQAARADPTRCLREE